MSKTPDLMGMLKAGLHFGHRTSKWHPRMEPYVFTSRNGIHIVNLEETSKALGRAVEFAKDITSKNGLILFLGSKPQIKEMTKKYAMEAEMPYVVERWLGGTITNFGIVSKGIKKYIELKEQKKKGEWDKYVKKERLKLDKELEKLEKKFGGMEIVKKIPDAILVVDAKGEKTAIKEAKIRKVPVIALCDTNINPDGINYVIPGNDDSIKGVKLIFETIVEAIKEGKSKKDLPAATTTLQAGEDKK
ncbi:30S ribosomal protein S2 [Candidatus Falkowbacteria bacterium]|jgi:small subunit ribosomal protein S2|nr:30S ribosomal protein S2 [Candidatus Falkowbacteria bacterium]MBT4433303.1 30S ribosomal protein S2 [Candidatus Falkowbacteria bacterium]